MILDLTSEAVVKPYWPQHLIFENFCLKSISYSDKVHKYGSFSNKVRNFQKILQKSSKTTQKSHSPLTSSMSAAGLLGPSSLSPPLCCDKDSSGEWLRGSGGGSYATLPARSPKAVAVGLLCVLGDKVDPSRGLRGLRHP